MFLDPEGRLHVKKASSSVEDYARAIVDGLREVFEATGLGGRDVAEVMHGTTVASNAILELRGARTGLITTRGFRDVLEIRHLRMPRLYDLTWEKPLWRRLLGVRGASRVRGWQLMSAGMGPKDGPTAPPERASVGYPRWLVGWAYIQCQLAIAPGLLNRTHSGIVSGGSRVIHQ